MATGSKVRKVEALELTPAIIAKISATALRIAQNDASVNVRELINAELLKREKAKVRYENGVTLTASAEILLLNATRQDYNHRRTLSRNIVAASEQARPKNVCAHHIVAANDPGADQSKKLLSGWGIGINDSDNGVFLPANKAGKKKFPTAALHTSWHSPDYHLSVYVRLMVRSDTAGGRSELKSIKSDLLEGRMSLV
jgi:hypothetical protein